MADLYPRIRAAIEGRLALARAATPGPWHRTWMGEKLAYALGSDVERDDGSRPVIGRAHHGPDADYMAANDPAWAIRALEADLSRLDRHAPKVISITGLNSAPTISKCWTCHLRPSWPCAEASALAFVYLEEEA